MEELEVREQIRLIKEMVEKTRRTTAESGTLFIFWGFLIIAAIVAMYILHFFRKFQWIWVNWVAFLIIGWAYSVLYGIKREKTEETETYAQMASKNLSLSCGIVFLLLGVIFPLLKVYSTEAISLVVTTIGGLLIFMAGAIFEWNLLKWCGLIWWLGALVMVPIPGAYRGLCLIPLIIFGYLVPGFIFRAKYKNNRHLNGS